jgi:SAM-dependent methyltransferase
VSGAGDGYTERFFVDRRAQVLASAGPILDLLFGVLAPRSVLDVGCGTGTWLAACKRMGATTILGIDGPWVPREHLEVDPGEFRVHDLNASVPDEVLRHDAALSIEVAEHLSPAAGDRLVEFLTDHADAVLFSAAIPGQGGTGHVNEQPQAYWCDRFARRGFECFDLVRPRVWDAPEINVIYKQNMLLYARRGSSSQDALLRGDVPRVGGAYALDRVHPDLYRMRLRDARRGLRSRVRARLTSLSRRFS